MPVVPPPLLEELGAGDDGLDQAVESMALGSEPVAHRLDRRLIRKDQASSQGINQQLAAECSRRSRPARCSAMYRRRPARPSPSLPSGNVALGLDRAIAEVAIAPLADRAIALENQPDRVEPLVAARTVLVGAVAGKKLRQAQLARLRFVLGKLGDDRRRGGMRSPSSLRTTQYPRFTGLVRKPGELAVKKTDIGNRPPRPKRSGIVDANPVVFSALGSRHAVVLGQDLDSRTCRRRTEGRAPSDRG